MTKSKGRGKSKGRVGRPSVGGSGSVRVLVTLSAEEHAFWFRVAKQFEMPLATLLREMLQQSEPAMRLTLDSFEEACVKGLSEEEYMAKILAQYFVSSKGN